MLCALTQFSHIRPRHEIDQEYILNWLAEMHALSAEREGEDFTLFYNKIKDKLNSLGVGKERIANRGSQISDLLQEVDSAEIYPVTTHSNGQGFTAKSAFFAREASTILARFYPENSPLPPHLVHVTCTGYVAPSPAQKLVSQRDAGKTTTVTHAYHMGCHGALSAIRIATGLLSLPASPQADIVHTELCSLHMHPSRHTTEQLVVQSLFSDGFIKYSAVSHASGPHIKVKALQEEILPESLYAMEWSCGDHGMNMVLSKEVPVLIARSLEGYLERLAARTQISKEKIKQEAFFAVHPGGPKIIEHVEKLLQLSPEQIRHSKEVLRNYGNMSSATLPHVWERILHDDTIAPGSLIVSLAFGPGLCTSGGLFQKCLT